LGPLLFQIRPDELDQGPYGWRHGSMRRGQG